MKIEKKKQEVIQFDCVVCWIWHYSYCINQGHNWFVSLRCSIGGEGDGPDGTRDGGAIEVHKCL